MSAQLSKVLAVIDQALSAQESIVRITLGEPLSASHADYFERYKVKIGKVNGSGTQVTDLRCVVVKISSNLGVAAIDAASCDLINDIG